MEESDARKRDQNLASWFRRISELKNKLPVAEAVENELLRTMYETYDGELRAAGAIDYDDLPLLTYRLFQEKPGIADFYRRQYKYTCIDEGQDLNQAQFQSLRALCGTEYKNVMVVGDSKQAIYVFCGAAPKFLYAFRDVFGEKTIELVDNFRSSKKVVTAAQCLDSEFELEGQLLIEGVVDILEFADEDKEAEFVCAQIEKLLRDGHPDVEGPIGLAQIAILGKNRFVFKKVEQCIKAKSWEYYKKVSVDACVSASDVVEEFELALRILSKPLDRLHLGLLLREWKVSASVTSFFAQVALGTTQAPNPDGTAIMTIHSAKGVEFDIVFVLAMAEGVLPDYRAKETSLDEEKRCSFSAVTRSKRLLYLTAPKSRIMRWGDPKPQTPSRYSPQCDRLSPDTRPPSRNECL